MSYSVTTYEGQSAFMVKNEEHLKQCPPEQCNCPCVCGGGDGGAQKDQKSGGDKKGGKSGQKKSKEHHDNGNHNGHKKG